MLFDRGELYGHLDKNTSSYTCWYFPYTKDWWRLSCRMIIQGTGFILAMMRIKGERKCEGPRRSPHVIGMWATGLGVDVGENVQEMVEFPYNIFIYRGTITQVTCTLGTCLKFRPK